MAITRALMKRQMYNMGGPTLEAGAPDLRLTGDQRNRGSYTQRRRAQMAGGGITQIGKPGGLVEPGIYKYGAWDWIKEQTGKLKDKFVDDIIPNEIKENKAVAALTGAALLNQFGIPFTGTAGDRMGQNWLGDLLGKDLVYGPGGEQFNFPLESTIGNLGTSGGLTPELAKHVFGMPGTGLDEPSWTGEGDSPYTGQTMQGYLTDYAKNVGTSMIQGTPVGDAYNAYKNLTGQGGSSAYNADGTPRINWQTPLAIGLAAGAADAATRKDYQLPEDLSINIPQTAQAAMDDPNLRFKPPLEATQLAADGGRIGYALGRGVESLPTDQMKEIKGQMAGPQWWWDRVQNLEYLGYSTEQASQIASDDDAYFEIVGGRAHGGRIGAQEGGLMDLGGMEKDYRQEGGFVPIGGQEKADDVPARLSKNEFVFTADAVRSAGGGDIDEGAAVMERLMENLEAGGKVSEESQGLEGAREMFATTQRLEKRIA